MTKTSRRRRASSARKTPIRLPAKQKRDLSVALDVSFLVELNGIEPMTS